MTIRVPIQFFTACQVCGEYIMPSVRVPYIVYSECIACGACAELCPEVFTVDEQAGYALVVDQGGADFPIIQEAMDNCPTRCIHWEDV